MRGDEDHGDPDEGDDRAASAGTAVGYRRPPPDTRFRKGQSGNPKGRPRGGRQDIPFDGVLGQKVTIREGGNERRVTAAEAFVRHLLRRGLDGDAGATRAALHLVEAARTTGLGNEEGITTIILRSVRPGSVAGAVESLRMGRKTDRFRGTACLLLEPWIVEAALARLGSRRLSREEQETVRAATRTPHKVKWPDWWASG